MERREFLKLSAMTAAAAMGAAGESDAEDVVQKPNLIFIVSDQRHYGMSKANGYAPYRQADPLPVGFVP